MPDRDVALAFVATGRVQGVNFRWSTREECVRLGVAGWIRNREDGAVEGVLQGHRDRVEDVVAWMRAGGPPSGRVDHLATHDAAIDPLIATFEIRR